GMYRAAGCAGGGRLGRRRGSQRQYIVRIHPRLTRQNRSSRRAPVSAYSSGSRIYAAGRRSLKNAAISLCLTFWFSVIFLGGFILFGLIMWTDLAYSLSQGRSRTLKRRAARIQEVMDATRHDLGRREAQVAQLTDVIPEGNLIHIFDTSGRRLYP